MASVKAKRNDFVRTIQEPNVVNSKVLAVFTIQTSGHEKEIFPNIKPPSRQILQRGPFTASSAGPFESIIISYAWTNLSTGRDRRVSTSRLLSVSSGTGWTTWVGPSGVGEPLQVLVDSFIRALVMLKRLKQTENINYTRGSPARFACQPRPRSAYGLVLPPPFNTISLVPITIKSWLTNRVFVVPNFKGLPWKETI